MKTLEIFSGAGGLAKGLELAGFQHEGFVEFNKDACQSLCRNFSPHRVFFGDIRNYDYSQLTDIDVVAGGPPCQPFSLGGKHRSDQDTRDMFPYAVEAIGKLNPKAFIFENVKGLLRASFSDYFKYVILRLTFPDVHPLIAGNWQQHLNFLASLNYDKYKGRKYRVSYQLLNAADYGVPQCRERVVIVGIRTDISAKWSFPSPGHSEERLLWDQYVTGEYWERHRISRKNRPECPESMSARVKKLRSVYGLFSPLSRPWLTVRDAIADVPDPQDNHGIPDHLFRDGARAYPGHTGSQLDWPAKTLKAGGHGVPGGENMIRYDDGSVRYFTVFEAKRIQTFPDDFVIAGAWGEAMRQIGNAVPVRLAKLIGTQLQRALRTATETAEDVALLDGRYAKYRAIGSFTEQESSSSL